MRSLQQGATKRLLKHQGIGEGVCETHLIVSVHINPKFSNALKKMTFVQRDADFSQFRRSLFGCSGLLGVYREKNFFVRIITSTDG